MNDNISLPQINKSTSLLSEDYVNPHKALWRRVILQALIDAFSTPTKKNGNSERHTKYEAQKWFTNNSEDFREVCSHADISHTKLVQRYEYLKATDNFNQNPESHPNLSLELLELA